LVDGQDLGAECPNVELIELAHSEVDRHPMIHNVCGVVGHIRFHG